MPSHAPRVTTTEFLRVIFPRPDGHIEIRVDDPSELKRRWCAHLEEVVPTASPYLYTARSIWFGPGIRRECKGTDDAVTQLTCLWAECDAKNCGGDKAQAITTLSSLSPSPTVVVDTGHGGQAYWTLTTPLVGDSLLDGRAAMRWIQDEITRVLGRRPDTVHNLGRMMRLPNTWNRKDLDVPVPCTVVAITGDTHSIDGFGRSDPGPASWCRSYPEGAFSAHVVAGNGQSAAAPDYHDLLKQAEMAGMPLWVSRALYRPDIYYHGDASALDWRVALYLTQYLALWEAEQVWLQSPLGGRAGDRKTRDRQDYRRMTLWNAKQKISQEQLRG